MYLLTWWSLNSTCECYGLSLICDQTLGLLGTFWGTHWSLLGLKGAWWLYLNCKGKRNQIKQLNSQMSSLKHIDCKLEWASWLSIGESNQPRLSKCFHMFISSVFFSSWKCHQMRSMFSGLSCGLLPNIASKKYLLKYNPIVQFVIYRYFSTIFTFQITISNNLLSTLSVAVQVALPTLLIATQA